MIPTNVLFSQPLVPCCKKTKEDGKPLKCDIDPHPPLRIRSAKSSSPIVTLFLATNTRRARLESPPRLHELGSQRDSLRQTRERPCAPRKEAHMTQRRAQAVTCLSHSRSRGERERERQIVKEERLSHTHAEITRNFRLIETPLELSRSYTVQTRRD